MSIYKNQLNFLKECRNNLNKIINNDDKIEFLNNKIKNTDCIINKFLIKTLISELSVDDKLNNNDYYNILIQINRYYFIEDAINHINPYIKKTGNKIQLMKIKNNLLKKKHKPEIVGLNQFRYL